MEKTVSKQFKLKGSSVSLQQRQLLLNNIFTNLVIGGAVLVSEKIKFADMPEQELHNMLHHRFKACNGYTALEITQKEQAIADILIPETIENNKKMLMTAGFSKIYVVFQFLNFCSILAIKS